MSATVSAIPPTDAATIFLERFRRDGGVLQTSFFTYDADDDPPDVEALSRQALLLRFEQMDAENAAFRAQLPPGTRAFELRRTPGMALVATRTTFATILGAAFDVNSAELRLFSFGADYKSRSSNDYEGLPRALLDPPYGVRVPGAREWPKTLAEEPAYHLAYGKVLRAYVEEVLGVSLFERDPAPPVCLRWSTDWTNYFDAGREWWGTFCWTLLRPADRVVIVLMASSTD